MGEYFTWDEVFESVVLAGPLKADEEKKKEKRKKTKQIGAKIYCPHKRLIFHFKDTLSFPEQYMKKDGKKVIETLHLIIQIVELINIHTPY